MTWPQALVDCVGLLVVLGIFLALMTGFWDILAALFVAMFVSEDDHK